MEKVKSSTVIDPFNTCFEVYVVVVGEVNSVDAWEVALEEIINQYPEYNPINAELIKTEAGIRSKRNVIKVFHNLYFDYLQLNLFM